MNQIEQKKQWNKILQILQEKNISFNDDFTKNLFKSHMTSLWERLTRNEVLNITSDQYKAVLNEIDYDILDYAKGIAEFIFRYFNRIPSEIEVILIATHLQLQKRKE